ncbi:extracellular matrix protein 1-like [Cynoglossus semilaevis]|uniref:extracellular matrix protein 1-like n=1 Tax=Cynoglossus semilaevis TaxID=244447 RepID=UPI000494F637|nr:extracellular matrix protein 1-like [Cynoglossus semilaevis]
MTSSWLLFSSTLVVLVLLGSASTPDEEDDSLMMQREVDLSDLIGSMVEQQPVMLQRELDEPDLPNPFEQTPSILGFRPRSFGLPPSMQYPVEFPLARPTPRNLDDICLYGDRRPHYPDSYFPSSGYGQLKRQAKAVNRVESWYRSCCERNQTWASGVTLCCAQRAWTRSLKVFCKESSSVKDRLHHCCKRSGNNVFSCFNSEAVNPHYQPTEEIPAPPLTSTPNFNFDPSTCQGYF